MPPVIQGAFTSSLRSVTDSLRGKDYNYKYPFNLDLRPGSDLHNKIVEKVMALAKDSNDQIKKRFESWREVDNTNNAYIQLSDYEKSLKKKDPTRPVSIVVPYSYAALETILAYKTKTFLGSEDVFQYEGVGPEDISSGLPSSACC